MKSFFSIYSIARMVCFYLILTQVQTGIWHALIALVGMVAVAFITAKEYTD